MNAFLNRVVAATPPWGLQVRFTQPLVRLPAAARRAVVVFAFGAAVRAGAHGIEGTEDDVDLRGSFTGIAGGLPPEAPRLLPNGVAVDVSIGPGPDTVAAAVEGLVPGGRRPATDRHLLIVMAQE